MLCGEAVVAIWNGIADEGRDDFYAWHLGEHIPERVGIPGFRRGRRCIAADAATQPEFFTLYEVDTFEVLQGQDYTNRLNAPTAWTRRATQHFRTSSRGLARVAASTGSGMGGAIMTLRFDAPDTARGTIADLVRGIAAAPRVTGAHLCIADAAASGVVTNEKRGRADIGAPPAWIALVEATGPDALDLLPDAQLHAAGAQGDIRRGRYRLEYVRTKTGFAP